MEQLTQLADRLGLNNHAMAVYLGVHVTTYDKWCKGTRAPNACLIRLLDVLAMIELLAPGIHETLLPKTHTMKRNRGRPKKQAP